MTAADAMVDDLASLYRWDLTTTQRLTLSAALHGHTRPQVHAIARSAADMGNLTPECLTGALRPSEDTPEPQGPTPFHLPSCECEGDGYLDGQPAGVLGDGDGQRTYTGVARCKGNSGRPISANQYSQWLRHQKLNGSTGQSREDKAPGRASIEAIRAKHLNPPDPNKVGAK